MSECGCGDRWRIEACDLRTGTVRAILHPTSFDWQTTLNRVGQGTLNLPTKAIGARDIWPHLTSIYVLRVAGGTATFEEPVVEFAGMIDSFAGTDSGSTSVGMKSIEQYLMHRKVRDTLTFSQVPQTAIATSLVAYCATNGIPLSAIADVSAFLRDRDYPSWERKNIGEAIIELTDVIDGVDWELVHTKTDGRWATQMVFRDYVGEDRNVIIKSNREAAGYGLTVDASDHATLVDAMGSGEEADQMISTAEDESGIYPQFDAAPAYKDVSIQSTLDSHAQGDLEALREPVAVPSATLKGLKSDPSLLRLGDTVTAKINHGAITFNGPARVTSISWGVGVDEADSRTLEMVPLTRASQSVLGQVATDNCEEC